MLVLFRLRRRGGGGEGYQWKNSVSKIFPKWQLYFYYHKLIFSQVAASQMCNFPTATFQVRSGQSAWPQIQPASPQRAKPNLWELATWEIAHFESCPFGNRPWKHAFEKVPNIHLCENIHFFYYFVHTFYIIWLYVVLFIPDIYKLNKCRLIYSGHLSIEKMSSYLFRIFINWINVVLFIPDIYQLNKCRLA